MAEPNAASSLEDMAAAAVQEAIRLGKGEGERMAPVDTTNSPKGDVELKGRAPSTPLRTERPFITYTTVTTRPAQGPYRAPASYINSSSSPGDSSVYSSNSQSYDPQMAIDETHGVQPQATAAASHDVLIQITVGQDEWKTVFLVSKNKLAQKAPMLSEQLKEHFEEGHNFSARLPDGCPLAFEIFARWLDYNIIINVNDQERICKALMELFFFAERYCIYELADKTIDAYIAHLIALNSLPLIPTLKTIWYNTQANSKFRLFLTKCWTYTFVHCGKYAGWPTADYCEGVGGLQLEGLQTLRVLLKPNSLIGAIEDPRYAPACDYHQHDKNYPCPLARQFRKRKREDGEEEDL